METASKVGATLPHVFVRENARKEVIMSTEIIGHVKTGKTHKSVQVKWDPYDKRVYVEWAGWSRVGEASSAGEAMHKAEAYLYDK